ncbi:MAG: hypothetical protein JST09_19250 [Bacteroidetes bacterium]|nr:hypothetical protein [Bacteroidota bacterium]
MKLFKHVFYSWVLAVSLTLAGLFVYDVAVHLPNLSGELFCFDSVILFFGAYVVAIPSLFIGLLFLQFIYFTQYSVFEKFLLWCVSGIAAIVLNILFALLIFAPGTIEMDMILIPWPAYMGLILSISLRYNYFFQLFTNSACNEGIK